MPISIALILLVVGISAPSVALAAGTVNRCTYAADPSPRRTTLAEALAGGGLVKFACGGTIVVPEIIIDNVTVIDATGQDVVLSAGTDFPRSRVFQVTPFGSLTLIGLTVENGNPFPDGAGGNIFNNGVLTVSNSVIRGGFAEFFAGGILNGGTLLVSDSTLSENTSSNGGAIYNFAGAFGSVSVTGSTLTANVAFRGAGIFNADGTATIVNSTISGNVGGRSLFDAGGGVYNTIFGLTILVHTTITANDVSSLDVHSGGGGIFNEGALRLQNSIVANQTAGGDCHTEPGATTLSQGYNIDSDSSCGLLDPTDLVDTDPLLGPLADNGGRTLTHALLPASPAIDRIPVGTNGCGTTITTDQRGAPRPLQIGCESGSVEFAVAVRIDITNERFNPESGRRLRVVIFGAADFPVGMVDPTTARLGPGLAAPLRRPVFDDVDGDGHLDLLLRFEADETGIECGDSTANLTAYTVGGVAIIGHDTFDTVRCR